MKIHDDNVIGMGTVPAWILHGVRYFSRLYDLGEYRLHVKHTTFKNGQLWLRRNGFPKLSGPAAACVVVDTTYLIAHILFFRGSVNRDANGYGTIAHELKHVAVRHRLLQRIKREVFNYEIEDAMIEAMVDIEERFIEGELGVYDKLGLFNSLASEKDITLKKFS